MRIVYDARPVVCEGAEVGLEPAGSSDEFVGGNGFAGDEVFYAPVVGVVAGMSCGLRLHVVNDGWSDVEVRTVELPSMDESHLSLVRPIFVNPNGQARLADTEDAAVFAIEGMTIPARGSQAFTVMLEVDEADSDSYEPCSGSSPRSPEVTVAALGVDQTVASPADFDLWYDDGPRSACE